MHNTHAAPENPDPPTDVPITSGITQTRVRGSAVHGSQRSWVRTSKCAAQHLKSFSENSILNLRSTHELRKSRPSRSQIAMCMLTGMPAVQDLELLACLHKPPDGEPYSKQALRRGCRCNTQRRKQRSSRATVYARAGQNAFAPVV